jgi:hypothetical protein
MNCMGTIILIVSSFSIIYDNFSWFKIFMDQSKTPLYTYLYNILNAFSFINKRDITIDVGICKSSVSFRCHLIEGWKSLDVCHMRIHDEDSRRYCKRMKEVVIGEPSNRTGSELVSHILVGIFHMLYQN